MPWHGIRDAKFIAKMTRPLIHHFLPCLLATLGGSASAEATIEGRVELPKAHTAPVVTQRNIIIKGGIVSTDPPMAVVYLEGSFARPQALPTAQMAQKDLRFVTPLLPVVVGTKVEFPNLDDTYHNIFSYSEAKRFDLGRYRPDERPIPSEIFDKPGLVTLHCDIHEHMRGLILVLATPHFATSDGGGRYRLAGLPSGHYVLKAWISSKKTLERPVELKDGAILHVDFP
jgi:plastocyanin